MISVKTRRKTSFIFLAFLLVGALLISGCAGDSSSEKGSDLTGDIVLAGSTSVQPFSEILAEEYMASHKGVNINVQGGGSSQGAAAALSGAADIGALSRELKDEEKSEGLTPIQIAIDGIAVVVNHSNGVSALTSEQVKSIYLGSIKNWKEVGGADAPITVVTREESSGTRDAFLEIIMNKENIISSAIVQNSTGAVRTTVAGDKNAIGYISLAKVNDEVKAVDIDRVEANPDNVINGSYKLQRPFYYVVKGQPDDLAQTFLDYVLSDEGQKIIEEEGAFSVK